MCCSKVINHDIDVGMLSGGDRVAWRQDKVIAKSKARSCTATQSLCSCMVQDERVSKMKVKCIFGMLLLLNLCPLRP